jgi:hypothetical protein
MSKYRFSYAQRYAVWLHHQQRCWLCEVPLRLAEVTVDHVIPESVEKTPGRLAALLLEYDLPDSFRTNGYQNWLPAHSKCNAEKSAKVFKMVPAYRLIFDHLIGTAGDVERTVDTVGGNRSKDKLLVKLASGIAAGSISLTDLTDFIAIFGVELVSGTQPTLDQGSFLKLDNGYWVKRNEIIAEGLCCCERETCVGHDERVYCYFPSHLSSWVQRTRLYYRCYDEIIRCPRCSEMHRRGYIGREGSCCRPFSDQEHQVDTHRSV